LSESASRPLAKLNRTSPNYCNYVKTILTRLANDIA